MNDASAQGEAIPAALTRRERNLRDRRRRWAARVEIDGRLVAVNATKHGVAATRINHGCECEPCRTAGREYNTRTRRELRQTNDNFRQRANAANRRWAARKRAEGTT